MDHYMYPRIGGDVFRLDSLAWRAFKVYIVVTSHYASSNQNWAIFHTQNSGFVWMVVIPLIRTSVVLSCEAVSLLFGRLGVLLGLGSNIVLTLFAAFKSVVNDITLRPQKDVVDL